jgi:hypothetical protein
MGPITLTTVLVDGTEDVKHFSNPEQAKTIAHKIVTGMYRISPKKDCLDYYPITQIRKVRVEGPGVSQEYLVESQG